MIILDSAGYGSLVVNKGVTIVVPSGIYGGITRNVPGAGISISAGVSEVVRIRGFDFTCSGSGTTGVAVTSAGRVELDRFNINNCVTGIDLAGTGTRALLTDMTLSDTGTAFRVRGNNSKTVIGMSSNLAWPPIRVISPDLALKWELGHLQMNGVSGLFLDKYYEVESTAGCVNSPQITNQGFNGYNPLSNYDLRMNPDNLPCQAP